MDVEIHTTTGAWITSLDEQALEDRSPGAAAKLVQQRLLEGEAVEVRPGDAPRDGRQPLLLAVFNPAHLICVVEAARRTRRLSGD